MRGSFSIEGADAAQFQVTVAGQAASLDYDNQNSAAGTDAYSFNVVYIRCDDRFVEAVTLNVTDSNEEVYSVNAPLYLLLSRQVIHSHFGE